MRTTFLTSKKEILEYWRSDVDILRRGIMKLREDFIQLENIDPFRYITITLVCMTIYHSNYMPKKTIAIVPEYAKTDNFSKMSIIWLNYVSNGNNIKHALNGGEKELTVGNKTYKVAGFCEETNTVYEFFGCFWHGCPNCYKPNIINSKNQKDMGTLNDLTVEKRDTIKNAGYNHVSTYECQLTKNKDFQKFAKNFTQEIVEQLNPRDAFYGLRTNATKLLYNLKTMSVDATLTFAVSIQPFKTTKNIQLVTLPKYSTPKSMTNLGTVSLNAKLSLQKDYIIPSYRKESK